MKSYKIINSRCFNKNRIKVIGPLKKLKIPLYFLKKVNTPAKKEII